MLNPDSGLDQPREADGTLGARLRRRVAAPGFVEGDSLDLHRHGAVQRRRAGRGQGRRRRDVATYLNTVLGSFTGANGYA